MAALPFEHPKLAVVAHLPDDSSLSFANALEKAVARSGQVLELRKVEALPRIAAVRRR